MTRKCAGLVPQQPPMIREPPNRIRNAIFRPVQLQPVPRAAETVRQDDVRSGLHEGAVQFGNPIRMLGIPEFGRIARPQAALEQVAAGGAVGEQPGSFRQ
jgi:hypothetical protein